MLAVSAADYPPVLWVVSGVGFSSSRGGGDRHSGHSLPGAGSPRLWIRGRLNEGPQHTCHGTAWLSHLKACIDSAPGRPAPRRRHFRAEPHEPRGSVSPADTQRVGVGVFLTSPHFSGLCRPRRVLHRGGGASVTCWAPC